MIFNSASEIRIVYLTGSLVFLQLYDNRQTDEFILSKRDLIMVLRNFYVEDIYDIVQAGIKGSIKVRVKEAVKHFPVEITVEDGYRYYCNLAELKYITNIIGNQKKMSQQ